MTQQIEALVKPELLIWARQSAGLSLEDSARKSQVKPVRLKEWEQGTSRPSIAQLRKLAHTYKRPLAVFFLDEAPRQPPMPVDFRRLDPTRAAPWSPELRLLVRKISLKRRTALELIQDLGDKPIMFSESASIGDDPEKVGLRIRRLLGGGDQPPAGDVRQQFNFWRSALENAGVLVFQAEKIEPAEMHGFSLVERPLPAIAVNIKDAFTRRNFSLFHETAHILLRNGGLCDFEVEEDKGSSQGIEPFCNHVAGAALVPASTLLRRSETPRQRVPSVPDEVLSSLGRYFGASPETIYRRLVVLDIVPLHAYLKWRDEYRKNYVPPAKNKEGFAPPPTMALATNGSLFTRLVLDAYAEEQIGAGDVLEFLGVRTKHLPQIQQALGASRQEAAEQP
jgi:Zn-dependent peptidase ImmA (M78 family)/transcriptional regulator with XRE-family HTH domain